MGKKRALTAKLAPRRLMSSAESTLVGTFAFDVVIKTCKFVDCVPFSEQLSCKLLPAQVLQGGPVQDVIPFRIHRGNQVVSGEAWRRSKRFILDVNSPIFGLNVVRTF
jgi:hypothetical protein